MMSTTNWNPSRAAEYITLTWNYSGRSINPGEVLQVTKTLSISNSIEGISNFSFDIVISPSLPGDLNFDGIINIYDVFIALMAYGSYPGHPKWNPFADMNNDGTVNIFDIILMARKIGKTV